MIISRKTLKETITRKYIEQGKSPEVAETLAETCLPEMEGDEILVSDENFAAMKEVVEKE
jgi:hypothetical protein